MYYPVIAGCRVRSWEGGGAMPTTQTHYTVIKVRLYPDAAQAALMEKTFGCCRYLWNQMLSDVQEFYAATDIHYIPTPAKYKKSAPFLSEVDSQALCSVHQNLRKAFLDFFRAPKHFGYPQYKSKKARKDTFTVFCRPYRTGPSVFLTGNGIQMPKLGIIKAKLHRRPNPGQELKYVTIMRTRSGKYFASIGFRYEAELPPQVLPTPGTTLGLNHSLVHYYTDSTGHCTDLPPYMARAKEKLARMQQRLSRMQHGSKNYAEQLHKIQLLHEHIANQRKDFAHKESRRTANAWNAVCVKDTDLIRLSQHIKGRNVMDSGFGMFRECLKYKLAEQGKPFIIIDRYAPTAKTCHVCGHIQDGLRSRTREWVCPHCGSVLAYEENAALNIRNMGLAQFGRQHQETGAFSAVS